MIDAGGEVNLRRLKRVVCREVYRKEKDTAGVWTVTLLVSRVSAIHVSIR